jgi:hypothetical protein
MPAKNYFKLIYWSAERFREEKIMIKFKLLNRDSTFAVKEMAPEALYGQYLQW